MAKVTSYAGVTTLNEAMVLYVAIDTDSDGTFESRKMTLATLRTNLYDTSSKMLKESKGSDIASAASLTPGADGNYYDITGVAAITGISSVKVGARIVFHFDSALVLTHHATDLILPGGANITTAAGDHAEFREYDTGLWRCTNYQVAALAPGITSTVIPTYIDAAPQALSGPGAIDIVSPVTNFTSTGATDALTLVDSTVLGQIKVINHEVDGGGYVLTPTTLSGGTTITVTDPSVSITLMWTASGWRLVGQVGVAVIA